MTDGALVSAGHAARRLGVTRRTIVRWIQSGKIAGVQIGTRWYVYRAVLHALLSPHT